MKVWKPSSSCSASSEAVNTSSSCAALSARRDAHARRSAAAFLFLHRNQHHVATLEHQPERVLHVLVQVGQDHEAIGMVGVPRAQRKGKLVEKRRGGDLHAGELNEQVLCAVACTLAQLLGDLTTERTRTDLSGTLNASASRFTDIAETIPLLLPVLA